MITLKSPAEIEAIRRAGQVVAGAHRKISAQIRPGVTTRELDGLAEKFIVAQRAECVFKGRPGPIPFPFATCMSVNGELTCGFPNDRALEDGDLLSVDIGCRLDEWCADAAVTYAVGHVDAPRQRLIEFGRRALQTAIQESIPGRLWSAVVGKLNESLPDEGPSIVPGFSGHGIGRELHEDPQVVHCPDEMTEANDFQLEPGLVFTIEPIAAERGCRVRRSSNGWTTMSSDGRPGVHFEHTIAITPDGPIILTDFGDGR